MGKYCREENKIDANTVKSTKQLIEICVAAKQGEQILIQTKIKIRY